MQAKKFSIFRRRIGLNVVILVLLGLLATGCTTVTESISTTYVYQPMQCETTPWEEWYASGEVNYITTPSQKQLLEDYYSQKLGIGVAVEVKYHDAVCEGCNICPRDFYFEVDLSRLPRVMVDHGWE